MTDELLYNKITALPQPLKVEILDYVDFLVQKYNQYKKVHPTAGCMQGTFIISDDFNEPLECFSEYIN